MKITFEHWMKEVDRNISLEIGLSSEDLPDICYRDMYVDGKTPKNVAKKAIKMANE